MKKQVVIIGGGPAGVMCAIEAAKNPENSVTIVEQKDILLTLLPTGGGRCNLAHNEFSYSKLAGNFPRGEKFLYSVFSRFGTKETMDFFENLGVRLKVQEDNRIFPVSDSAKQVREALLKEVERLNIKQIKQRAFDVQKVGDVFEIDFRNKSNISADVLVLATGGSAGGHRLAQDLGHRIVSPTPSLCPLKIKETQFYELTGVSLQKLSTKIKFKNKTLFKLQDDLLFAHNSISGPLVLKISSLCALKDFDFENPLQMEVNFVDKTFDDFKQILKKELDENPKKDLINVCSKFVSRFLAHKLLEIVEIPADLKCADVSKIKLNAICEIFTNYTFNIVSRLSQNAMVTAGGVSLKEVNSKNLQSKIHKNLFFCGEVLDIDALTGGFNLQNCWSTGFLAGEFISGKLN